MTPALRPVTDDDWPGIVALEFEAYAATGLSEDPAVLATRADPGTSYVLATADGIVGHLLALRYPRFRWPDLTRAATAVHGCANLHLHDLVVARTHRHQGLGGRLVRHLLRQARRRACATVSLVAVEGSAGFWSAHGFHPHPGIAVPAGYGPGAGYLSRTL
ncbi:hypothetical protein KRMM14A1259_06710 [Krasilnikovia sp. MM14-A1259]